MEMHLVHKNQQGELAVVGVFFEQGEANPQLVKIWDTMPQHAGQQKKLAGIKASALLPEKYSYSHFKGSLTTPPCSEGVNWFVLQKPVSASSSQIRALHRLVGDNARPTQPLNNRFVLAN